jgi:hypothetical protein
MLAFFQVNREASDQRRGIITGCERLTCAESSPFGLRGFFALRRTRLNGESE